MSEKYNLDEIKFFAVNVMDLTRLNPIELLLVNDKIESHLIINVNKNKIDGHAVLLQSPLKNDYSFDFEKKKKRNLFATCQILWEKLRVRSYYSKNGKNFYNLKF
ncbi:MAG: hypothetical protein ACFE85_00515 [Candidatus Hodarchaeota archaeon]